MVHIDRESDGIARVENLSPVSEEVVEVRFGFYLVDVEVISVGVHLLPDVNDGAALFRMGRPGNQKEQDRNNQTRFGFHGPMLRTAPEEWGKFLFLAAIPASGDVLRHNNATPS